MKKLENKRMLLVFPHPDDETVWAAGLMQRASRLGWRVRVVCLTKGERGQVHIKPNGKSLSQIRELEMALAMKILGADYDMYDFGDGRLKGSSRWKNLVKKEMDEFGPSVVVTYDHSGMSGHPDHICVSMELLAAVKKTEAELWWVSAAEAVREFVKQKAKTDKYLSNPNMELRMGIGEWWQKMRALVAHRSQPLGSVVKLFLFNWVEYFYWVDKSKKYEHEYVEYKI